MLVAKFLRIVKARKRRRTLVDIRREVREGRISVESAVQQISPLEFLRVH